MSAAAQEICNNGKDDDNDGLTDLQDPDCQCRFKVNGNMLQNASFESYDHCPVNYLFTTDHNIISQWEYGTYTNINTANFYHNFQCSYDSGQVMRYMPPTGPLPNGNGFVSIRQDAYINPNYPENEMTKSYVGQCLQTPLKAGEDYTLSFDAGRFRSWDNYSGNIYPFIVAVFGNANCNAVPFGKVDAKGNGCPANYPGWILLGKTVLNSPGRWLQGKVRLTIPFDIRVIQIGTDCSILQPIHSLADSTTFLDYHQYYLDDLHLLPTKDFPFIYIQPQVGSNCNVLPVLTTPLIANASYQWYKDSIAIKDETGNVYNVTGTKEKSNYNVRVTTGVNCVVSEPFLVVASKLNVIQIPADTTLCNKDSNVLIAPAFEGIIYTVNAVRSNEVRVNKAGMYDITATDAIGCERHFVVQVSKTNCDSCAPFIPTAFTPNNDGLNDIFRPTFNCRVNDFGVIIFNRWGQKVFESSDVNQGWDGTYQGKRLSPGLYVYTIHYNTISKIKKTVKGTVLFVQ